MRRGNKPARESNGRYKVEQRCDACAKPIHGTHYTDDAVCGGGDGPGFFLCGRVRCSKRYENMSVEERRAFFKRTEADGRIGIFPPGYGWSAE